MRTAALVLDVRTPDEFTSGHVPGAMNISHEQLASQLDEFGTAKDKPVVVYCERGRPSRESRESRGDPKIRDGDAARAAMRFCCFCCSVCTLPSRPQIMLRKTQDIPNQMSQVST